MMISSVFMVRAMFDLKMAANMTYLYLAETERKL